MKYLFVLVLTALIACSGDSDPEPSAACVEITEAIKVTDRAIKNFQGSDRQALADLRRTHDSLVVQQKNICK